jgi:sporulenol synthase
MTSRTTAAPASLSRALDRACAWLRSRQLADGRFPFCLEANALTDANMLIASRLGGFDDEPLVQRLAARLLETQRPSGAWSRYPDDAGDPSSTIESYLALRLAGRSRDEPELRRARDFIRASGGLASASSLTQVILAIGGLISWSDVPALPPELLLVPARGPLTLADFASFTRVHLPSLMILAARRYVAPVAPDLSELERGSARPGRWLLAAYLRCLGGGQRLLEGSRLRALALERCERFLLDHQEPDGTVGSYILATIFFVFALRARGYALDHPRLRAAWRGLRALVWESGGLCHMQPCTSTLWDTALAARALREAADPRAGDALERAARFLRAREARQGGWGFQDVNALFPDVDDTVVTLEVLRAGGARRDAAIERGLDWVLGMQNRDGGWSAFDRDCDKRWLEKIPFNDMLRAMTDPSSADMTGRMLELLGGLGARRGDARVDRAVRWLEGDQRPDGSWFGRWGIAYVYGTSGALQGLGAVGVHGDSPAVRRGVAFLERVQGADGGFGESARSDVAGSYVPLAHATPSQTAWAALGLTAAEAGPEPVPALRRAIAWLVERQSPAGHWEERYPTGAGFAGKIYLRYHSYAQVWPTLALARYRRRFPGASDAASQ